MIMVLDREYVKRAFASYTEHYDPDDPKIKLKIDHTYRVADLCERIAATVSGADTDLSWLAGMLHDIGRFEQVRRYGTFADAQSVDHAALGADLLFKEGLMESFGDYDERTLDILEKAIRNHNRFRIEDGLSEEYMVYCRILRDADKIDILRVNTETPIEEIYNVTTDELRSSAVSEEVKQGFRERRAILRSKRLTMADILVSHVCLVFELVYPVSIQIVREQGYLYQLLAFESRNEDTKAWFEYMRNYLLSGLGTGQNEAK